MPHRHSHAAGAGHDHGSVLRRVASRRRRDVVLPVCEAGEDDDQLYLAMRYVPGVDLAIQLARLGGGAQPGRWFWQPRAGSTALSPDAARLI